MSVPELTITEILDQLTTEGKLHWENAVLKAQLAKVKAEKPEETPEEMGQSDN